MVKNTSNEFVEFLHFFRAFAIVCIVGAHAWSFPTFVYGGAQNFNGHIYLYTLTETLFHGSTLYFALISGLLYGHILKRRSIQSFARSKVLNVLFPYLFVSLVFSWLSWHLNTTEDKTHWFSLAFFWETLQNILYGRVHVHFWYIPILLALFTATHLLHWCYKKSHLSLLLVALLPFIFSRTIYPNFLTLNSFFYFLGIYSLGIWCGENLETILKLGKIYRNHLLVVAAISSAIVATLIFNKYPANQGYSWLQSTIYIQKFSISILVILWLERLSLTHGFNKIKSTLSLLGSYSFSIYFLHLVVLFPLSEQCKKFVPDLSTGGLIGLGLAMLAASLIVPTLIAMLFKAALGKRSRWFVGA